MMLLPSSLRKASVVAAALLAGAAAAATTTTSAAAAAEAAAAATRGTTRTDRLRAKLDFVRTMQQSVRNEEEEEERDDANAPLGQEAAARRRMRQRVLSGAVRRRPSSPFEGEDVPDFLRTTTAGDRHQHQHQRLPMTPRRRRKLEDGGDDDDGVDWEQFGFDPSEYSIKYTGCASVASYSDDEADNEDGGDNGILAVHKFVIFRLCPTSSCSDDDDDGCDEDYGEYLLPLEEYLLSYAAFREEVSESYCDYCGQCMYYENYFYGGNGANRELEDADGAEEEDQDGDADADADEEEEEVVDDGNHACKYYSSCVDYLYTCDYDAWYEENYDDDNNANGDDDDADEDEEIDFEQFFECTEFDYGNYVYYVGPMCDEDDGVIKFAIFSDEYCTVDAGDNIDIFTLTGLDSASEEAALDFFSSRDCVSCKESEQPYMVVAHDADDADEISELCEEMYTNSARCNKRIWDAEGLTSYQSNNNKLNDERTCSFIENIVSGTYEDEGYVAVDATGGSSTSSSSSSSSVSSELFSVHEISQATAPQIFGLFVMSTAVAVLVVWACFLHRGLRQQRMTNKQMRLLHHPVFDGEPPPRSPTNKGSLSPPGSPAHGGLRATDSGVMQSRSNHEEEQSPRKKTKKATMAQPPPPPFGGFFGPQVPLNRQDSGVMMNRSSSTEEDTTWA